MEKQPAGNEMRKFKELSFGLTQKIQQRLGENERDLHERLRPTVLESFNVVVEPTRITTPSWYTFDLSRVSIPGAVAVCTSTCKHETPLQILIGISREDLQRGLETKRTLEGHTIFEYILFPLGRDLSEEEKNKIYDQM